MSASVIVSTPSEGVRLLEIDRPARRNALDTATYLALVAGLKEADGDDAIRAIVLAGTQGVFTAGNDLADFQVGERDGARAALQFLDAISTCGTPVVAGVEGFAVGIGTTMLLHCDLAYAGRSARLKMPFVQLGLCPEGASSLLLPLVAGHKAASQLLLLGEEFSGADAAAYGIVNEAVEDGAAVARALDRAGALARLPADSVRTSKALLRHANAAAVAETLAREGIAFERLRAAPAAQAAFAAFLRKAQ
jgi:enoyl-CoA hydratase/carnithine racemase